MPDVVLPAIGAVFGGISFLVTIRNGVDIIVRDTARFKSHGRNLILLQSEVQEYAFRIQMWCQFWGIQESLPRFVLETYWGQNVGDIEKLLLWIKWESHRLDEKFQQQYGNILKDAKNERPQEAPRGDENLAFDIQTAGKAREEQLARYKEEFGPFKRMSKTFLRSPIFREELDKLRDTIKSLENLGELYLKGEWEGVNVENKEQLKNFVRGLRHSRLLVHLTQISTVASRALLGLLPQSSNTTFDLVVNQWYGVSTKDRDSVLSSRAREGAIPYVFRTSGIRATPPKKLTVTMGKTAQLEEVITNIDQMQRESRSRAFLKDRSVRRPFKCESAEAENRRYQPLRAFLLSNKPWTLKESTFSNFSFKERIKLAYELVETALIFLKTNFLSSICTCCILRPSTLRYHDDLDHWIRLNNIKHRHPWAWDDEDSNADKPWCEEELQQMHFQRLGIVLMEIALGKPVANAGVSHDHDQLEIDDDLEKLMEQTPAPSIEDLLQNLKHAAGENYTRAVKYCLDNTRSPLYVDKDDLQNFYFEVLQQLRGSYMDQVLRQKEYECL